jgi:hypothetical protein
LWTDFHQRRALEYRLLSALMANSEADPCNEGVAPLCSESNLRIEDWAKLGGADLDLPSDNDGDPWLLQESPDLGQPRGGANEGDDVSPTQP